MTAAPTLRLERAILRDCPGHLACIDEVGRGALAGPVSVGVVVISLQTRPAPTGLRDSKLLSPQARRALLPALRKWPLEYAVGHCEAAEIDEVGIIAALRVAAARAFARLSINPEWALLDGNHNWLTVPQDPLALFADPRLRRAAELADLNILPACVITRVKADLSCSGVAGASVLAKCERDDRMIASARSMPQYGWAQNKGYSTEDHAAALRVHGPSTEHRRSWNLPDGGCGAGLDLTDSAQRVRSPQAPMRIPS
jgi:ribonuclease HII